MLLHITGICAAVFAAGALSSIGPCVAPRFIAVAGLAADRGAREALLYAAAFIAGVAALYASLGAAAAVVLHNAVFSAAAYWVIAAALSIAGVVQLCRRSEHCAHITDVSVSPGLGAAFLLGASSGVAVSPCCAPMLTAIVAYASADGDAIGGALLLFCYAVGHSIPLFAAAAGAGSAGALLTRHSIRSAASLLSGTLLLALGGYYAVLA
jgi:cytochrome c-type biogenesis protein